MPKQINPLKNYPDPVSCKIERIWPRKLEKREKEKVLSILEPVVSRGVLLSEFVRENWLRERNLSVKRDIEKTKSRLNEREEAILL